MNMRNNFKKAFKHSLTAAAVIVSLGLAMPALAADGDVVGKSVSAEGAVLAEVTIKIVNLATGLTRTVVSDAVGHYRLPLVPAGQYSLEATKNGFTVLKQDSFNVSSVGATRVNLTLEGGDMETITVTGAAVSLVDVGSSESQLVIDVEYLNKIPVGRSKSSVALLAPGTVAGDSDFGHLASFGGSSVGENSYYINGINTTNFRNGLGGSSLPFDMYKSFEVKTGGYSAEYGRSTGGVVNAVTKSGSNEFKSGVNVYWSPKALRELKPDVKRTDAQDIIDSNSHYYVVNNKDEYESTNFNIWASGALIKNKLFFFGLLKQRNVLSNSASSANIYHTKSSNTSFALKLDWYMTDDHILEFTGWDNGRDYDKTKNSYNPDTDTTGEHLGDYILERGGQTWGLKYTGILTDDLTLSTQYSINETRANNINVGANPLGDKPVIYERFSDRDFGAYGLFSPSIQNDTRTAMRIDIDWYVHDDHTLRFGIDHENMKATENTQRSGGVAYRYQDCVPELIAVGQLDCDTVRQGYYVNKGDFKTQSSAFYIEDTWQISDNVVARIGLRNETFQNFNKVGDKFIDVNNQWAPRLGLSWDVKGDGDSKVFVNFGRYFLPVATNTNIRMAGDELYTRQLYKVISIGDDFVPVLGDKVGPYNVYDNGKLKYTGETVDASIEPMYQDEIILGYQQVIDDSWRFGVKGTYRILGSSIEDITLGQGFKKFLAAQGETCKLCTDRNYYVLTNPGTDVTITTDPNGGNNRQTYTIPADVLGYPKAERQYASIDVTLDRAWDDVWMTSFIYTWAHSWGNNEGYVRSDNDQDDAGLTNNFDHPGLTDGAKGNLPNDRRHQIKINGAYQIIENLTLGASFNFTTGRPKSSFGHHPTDKAASLNFQNDSFVKDGALKARGTDGITPNTWRLNLSATYNVFWDERKITLRAEVFNVTNNNKATQFNEVNDRRSGFDADNMPVIEPNPTFGLPTEFQSPRSFRLSVHAEF